MRPTSKAGPPPCSHLAGVGAQTAPQAPRPPPLRDRDARESAISPQRTSVIGDSLGFGPQTAPDGRPPALMESLRSARRHFAVRGAGPEAASPAVQLLLMAA